MTSVQRQRDQERRRRQAQAPRVRDGLIASPAKTEGSPCQLNDDSLGGEIEMYSGPTLPEDIWSHIHSLMPIRDAARAACVSRSFLCSWRHHPNLIFDFKTLGLDTNACGNDEIAEDFCIKVDQILKKHSGIGVKRLKIQLKYYNAKDSCHLNHWLQIAVTPGIEELVLSLPMNSKYRFPYSLLCNRSGDSIRSLCLFNCSFRPTAELGWLRRLTRLYLRDVRIKGDELGCLLSNSFALERLEISYCDWIVCLKIPCLLQQLSYLEVCSCERLRMIDMKAPNISSFCYSGDTDVQLSLGGKLQMKGLRIFFSGAVHYARVELPSSMPNLETLSIVSYKEVTNTPMQHSKFLHLKKLSIGLNAAPFSPAYDYFSLVSFLDACPSLETFVLDVSQRCRGHVSIFSDDSDLRQIREHHHHKIKRVDILGFSSAKSLVELTCHVVESIMSLKCLVLDASQCFMKCSHPGNKYGECLPWMPTVELMEARRAVLAIRTYIEPKVPSTVKLHVVEPCSRCHDVVALDV